MKSFNCCSLKKRTLIMYVRGMPLGLLLVFLSGLGVGWLTGQIPSWVTIICLIGLTVYAFKDVFRSSR